jgi:F-type H+-transporting ATPase subunit b
MMLLASGPQAINVDVDLTFLVQLALVVALMLILKPILFEPMLRLFEEREKRTLGAKAQARKIDEKSASALSKYESEMAGARAAGNTEREKIRAEGLKREQEILSSTRAAMAKALDEGKRTAQTDAERARTALKRDAEAMARELANRVLGREVQQ